MNERRSMGLIHNTRENEKGNQQKGYGAHDAAWKIAWLGSEAPEVQRTIKQ